MIIVKEVKKNIIDSDSEEVIKLLESLDADSKILAKTYLSALVDMQWLKKSKPKAV